MDAKALPKTLYKYRDWRNEHHKRILTHNEIYFASPASFNDPFDCKVPFRYDLICEQPDDEQVNFYARAVYGFEDDRTRAAAEEAVRSGFFRDKQKLESIVANDVADRDRHGVFSVSSRRNRILMWSHYADKHRGFCVGLDAHSLDVFLNNFLTDDLYSSSYDPTEVRYAAKYPLYIPSKMRDEDYLEGWFAHKASVWRYEREYRYVVRNIQNRVVTIWPQAITEVILGCAMPESDKQEIISVLKMREPKPRLFRATKKEHEFGLDIIPIDY